MNNDVMNRSSVENTKGATLKGIHLFCIAMAAAFGPVGCDTKSVSGDDSDSYDSASPDGGGLDDTDSKLSWTNEIPPLHIEGREFKDPAGNTVVLRGVAVADPLDVNNRRTGRTMIELLDTLTDADDGFYTRVVRLTVYPAIELDDPESYFAEHYDPALEHATALGLYVIVDWHEIADVETVIGRTAEFWEFAAPKYADRTNVLFEIFNEPMNNDDPSWERWKRHAQPVVDRIRDVAPNNIILIGGPYWDQQIDGAVDDPFEGDNLAYVGHIYPIAKDLLSDNSPIAKAAAVRPVIITEWGFRDDDDIVAGGTAEDYGEPLKAFIEDRGLSWTAWCADSVWAPEMFDASWNLLIGPGEMGGFVKEWLYDRRDDDQPSRQTP